MRHRLHHQHDRVNVRDALPRDLDHIVSQTVARLVEAGRVEQDELDIVPVHHAVDPVARGLRLVGDDGDLLAHKRVRQARLAHVRPPADGDHGSSFDFHR